MSGILGNTIKVAIRSITANYGSQQAENHAFRGHLYKRGSATMGRTGVVPPHQSPYIYVLMRGILENTIKAASRDITGKLQQSACRKGWISGHSYKRGSTTTGFTGVVPMH